MTFTHLVEDRDKSVVLLAVDMLQLDSDIVDACEGFGPEEIRGVVIGPQHLLIVGCHHGGELRQVAYHEKLHATKRQVVVAETAQHAVDGIKQVGTHHGYLVDDEQVDGSENLSFLTAEIELALHLRAGHEGSEGQLEERMDGDTARIDGCHTRGSDDDGPFARFLHHGLQECRLARASLTSKKNAPAGVLHEVPCQAQLIIALHRRCQE